ncbi:MAG: GNAT family N-acetyltransferase [Nitrosopumilaceae archaeon]|nr:GNAT family N-acetyltransferase [Nitrosopumilaceae archaeon]
MSTIRDAAHGDVPFVLDLLYELGRPRPAGEQEEDMFKRVISGYIADADKGLLVAESDHSVVGLVSIMFLARCNHAGPEMYIPELVVRADCRGRGIGRALAEECMRIAGTRGCHRIRLESGNQRMDSHDFYRHLGFSQQALSFEFLIS